MRKRKSDISSPIEIAMIMYTLRSTNSFCENLSPKRSKNAHSDNVGMKLFHMPHHRCTSMERQAHIVGILFLSTSSRRHDDVHMRLRGINSFYLGR